MYPVNTIKGQKPQFGNPEHIAFVKRMNRIFSGEESFHQIEWCYAISHNKRNETGKPIFHYATREDCDSLVNRVPCPKCQRLHVLLVHIDPQDVWFESLLAADQSVQEFNCWNCNLEFKTDEDRNVFVKIN